MDHARFSALAHREHAYCNPVSPARMAHVVRALVFYPAGFTIPDLGFRSATAVEVQGGPTVDLWGYSP